MSVVLALRHAEIDKVVDLHWDTEAEEVTDSETVPDLQPVPLPERGLVGDWE